MSETTEETGTQAPPPPPQRTSQPPPSQHVAQPPAPATTRHESTVAELRAEAASWRVALRQAEAARDAAMQAAEDAKAQMESARTSAVEPLQKRLDRASQRMIDTTIQSEMIAMGLVDPDLIALAARMPDRPKVDVNDDFEVTGAKEFAKAFKAWKPDYFRQADATAPTSKREEKKPPPARTSAGQEPPASNGETTLDVRKMDKKDYANWKKELMRSFHGPQQR